ncbi:hypothetical protein IDJ81_09680 [Tsuneonella flava]|uniref:Uncharacterized protein n=2 Tax=Tsuneonella flava TaxID=2055955 RepID=A0ABX7K620_9SPHN|nr:hypothetical protein IDJ81_09680 [Tsuneonella flava]
MHNTAHYIVSAMFRMSPQVKIAAVASALALVALAISAPAIEGGSQNGRHSLYPAMAELPTPNLPTFSILPY